MKKQKDNDTFLKYTVIFGYALLISALFLELIGTGLLINNIATNHNSEMRSRFITVIILMSVSVILPPLISYFTGELSTKKKLSNLTHHFNGVLFASTAFILWLLITTINFNWIIQPDISFIPGRFLQFWPALPTIIVMIALGIGYAKSKTNDNVLSFKPFNITLLVAVFGWMTVGFFSLIEQLSNTYALQAFTNSILPNALNTLVIIGMFIFAHNLHLSRQYPLLKRAATAGTMTIIGVLILSVIAQIAARITTHSSTLTISLISAILGLSVWLAYLRLSSSRKRS
jgi:hypothetical protein